MDSDETDTEALMPRGNNAPRDGPEPAPATVIAATDDEEPFREQLLEDSNTTSASGDASGGTKQEERSPLRDSDPSAIDTGKPSALARPSSQTWANASVAENADELDALIPHTETELVHLKDRDGFGSTRDEAKFAERKVLWWQTAFLMIADIVGTGILALPGNLAKLDWALGLSCLFVFYPLNFYTGDLLKRLHLAYPDAVSLIDLGKAVSGRLAETYLFYFVHFYFITVCGGYLLVIAKSVQAMLYSSRVCLPEASLLAVAALLPINQLRSLDGLKYFCLVSGLTIVFAVLVCIVELYREGDDQSYGDEEKVDRNLFTGISALTGIVFAYSGQSIFMELMSEMAEPKDFRKSMVATGPFLVGTYTLVACTGYAYRGDRTPAYLLDVLPYNGTRLAANIFMFIHMIVSYSITSQVFCRSVHTRLSPATCNAGNMKARIWWFGISSIFVFSTFIIATGIPFFDDLTGITGALQSGQISFGIPAWAALQAARQGKLSLRGTEASIQVGLIVFTLFLIIAGLIANIHSIVEHSRTIGAPFSCHCSAKPGVCGDE